MGDATQRAFPAAADAGVECDPDNVVATGTEYEVRNKRKPLNYIIGELVAGGQLSFIVENQPKDGTGCRGSWLFHEMMRHFGTGVTAIQGNWTYGDNLATVNQLTNAGESLEEAAKRSFTGKRAAEWGFINVQVLSRIQGTQGNYVKVHVLFEK